MSTQPAPFPRDVDELADAVLKAAPVPYRVTVSVELVEGHGWSLVELAAVESSPWLALHTAAAAVDEALHVHPTTRDGSSRNRQAAQL